MRQWTQEDRPGRVGVEPEELISGGRLRESAALLPWVRLTGNDLDRIAQTRWRRIATATAAVREGASSLRRIIATWALTVRGRNPSPAATSLSVPPAAIS